MYNKILIPLDGSKMGEAAIPYVDEIILGAKESRRIEITLLQVVPSKQEIIPQSYAWPAGVARVPYTPEELEQIKKSVLEYLDKIGAAFRIDPNVTIKSLVKVGDDPADKILKTCDELQIDLIVISTHGRSGLTRWAYGSVADRILRGGTTPVFMVRSGKPA
jgi:nucleotide-binding universal stress UspA family protein